MYAAIFFMPKLLPLVCMNQVENAKNSTLGFSNRHRALKIATSKIMIKQDVAQFRNVIAIMMVKIYKHLTKLSTNIANF